MEKVKLYLESNGKSVTKLEANTPETESLNFNRRCSSIEISPVMLKGIDDKVFF